MVRRNKSKNKFFCFKNQYISTKVVQVLYCNLQGSILNCQIKIYFFIYCLAYEKRIRPGLISVTVIDVRLESEYDATVFRLFRKMFLLRLE